MDPDGSPVYSVANSPGGAIVTYGSKYEDLKPI
jgi:hypothetical protein